MAGWVKLHRKILDWEWFDDTNTFRLFIHLLLTVNHKDKNWRGIEVKSGQRITSYQKLSDETGLTINQIRTSIKKLVTTQEISIKSHSKFSLVTIEKWGMYQSEDEHNHKQTTNKPQTNHKQITNKSQQLKNVKNDKKERKKEKDFVANAPSLNSSSSEDPYLSFD